MHTCAEHARVATVGLHDGSAPEYLKANDSSSELALATRSGSELSSERVWPVVLNVASMERPHDGRSPLGRRPTSSSESSRTDTVSEGCADHRLCSESS